MSLLRKGIIAGGGSLVCAALGLIGSILLSRVLLPEGMGRYQLPLTAVMLAMTILSLGIGQSNIFFLNRHRISKPQIMMNSLWFGLFGSLLLVILMPLLLAVFAGYFGELPFWTKMVLGIDAAMLFCFNLFRPILTASLMVRQDTLAMVSQRASICVLVLIGIFLGIITVPVALSLTCVGDALALGMVIYYLREHIQFSTAFAWDIFKQTLLYGLKIFAAHFVYIVNTSIGLLLLRYLVADDFAMVGNYSRAVTLSGLVMLVPMAAGPLLYARWSGCSAAELGYQVALAMRLHLMLAAVIIAALVAGAPIIVRLLYGEAFLPAASALRILAFAIGFRCLFIVCYNLFASDGHVNVTAYIYGSSIIVTGLLTWVFMPYLGIRAPALADTIASVLVFITGLIILKIRYNFAVSKLILPTISDFSFVINAVSTKGPGNRPVPAGDVLTAEGNDPENK